MFCVSKTPTPTGPFENLKRFYPPEKAAKADPRGPHEKYFPFVGLEKGVGVSKTSRVRGLYENLRFFLSPVRVCFAAPKGSNCF